VRRGDWWNFNLGCRASCAREFSRPAPDLVIEDINKVPCFTPRWTRARSAVIVPHLFGSTAFQEANPVVASYVVALEALIPPSTGSPFLVISESTRDDLVARGIARERITVVHCGLDHQTYRVDPAVAQTPTPTILFVGRLRRYKGVDWVMRRAAARARAVPGARFAVIGDGPFRAELERMAARLGVADAVAFLGFLPRADKVRRMQSAWVVVQPSPKEGWGLTVVEAGACGTAVVAADSPGLRDSVRHDQTGLLVPFGNDARARRCARAVLRDDASARPAARRRESRGRPLPVAGLRGALARRRSTGREGGMSKNSVTPPRSSRRSVLSLGLLSVPGPAREVERGQATFEHTRPNGWWRRS
jgi:glycosyltransferase involved in cell wall biosynthesis